MLNKQKIACILLGILGMVDMGALINTDTQKLFKAFGIEGLTNGIIRLKRTYQPTGIFYYSGPAGYFTSKYMYNKSESRELYRIRAGFADDSLFKQESVVIQSKYAYGLKYLSPAGQPKVELTAFLIQADASLTDLENIVNSIAQLAHAYFANQAGISGSINYAKLSDNLIEIFKDVFSGYRNKALVYSDDGKPTGQLEDATIKSIIETTIDKMIKDLGDKSGDGKIKTSFSSRQIATAINDRLDKKADYNYKDTGSKDLLENLKNATDLQSKYKDAYRPIFTGSKLIGFMGYDYAASASVSSLYGKPSFFITPKYAFKLNYDNIINTAKIQEGLSNPVITDLKLDEKTDANDIGKMINDIAKAVHGFLGSKKFWVAAEYRGGTSAANKYTRFITVMASILSEIIFKFNQQQSRESRIDLQKTSQIITGMVNEILPGDSDLKSVKTDLIRGLNTSYSGFYQAAEEITKREDLKSKEIYVAEAILAQAEAEIYAGVIHAKLSTVEQLRTQVISVFGSVFGFVSELDTSKNEAEEAANRARVSKTSKEAQEAAEEAKAAANKLKVVFEKYSATLTPEEQTKLDEAKQQFEAVKKSPTLAQAQRLKEAYTNPILSLAAAGNLTQAKELITKAEDASANERELIKESAAIETKGDQEQIKTISAEIKNTDLNKKIGKDLDQAERFLESARLISGTEDIARQANDIEKRITDLRDAIMRLEALKSKLPALLEELQKAKTVAEAKKAPEDAADAGWDLWQFVPKIWTGSSTPAPAGTSVETQTLRSISDTESTASGSESSTGGSGASVYSTKGSESESDYLKAVEAAK